MFDFLKRPAITGVNKSGPRSARVTRVVTDKDGGTTVFFFKINSTGKKGSGTVSSEFAPIEGETIYYTDTIV